jgi:hypothetical protein
MARSFVEPRVSGGFANGLHSLENAQALFLSRFGDLLSFACLFSYELVPVPILVPVRDFVLHFLALGDDLAQTASHNSLYLLKNAIDKLQN